MASAAPPERSGSAAGTPVGPAGAGPDAPGAPRENPGLHERAGGGRSRGSASILALAGLLVAALTGVFVGAPASTVDLLLTRDEGGTTVVDPVTGALRASSAGGVPSPDGAVVVSARPDGDRTELVALDVGRGTEQWRRVVAGRQAVRLVGGDGRTVVLAPATDAAGLYQPVGRSRTALAVSRADGSVQTYDLPGNLEPEALSRDNSSLFVISYVPPTAPSRYQVRRLDLASGEVRDVQTPDAELQQEMGGTARTQLWSADGNRLYTLYTLGEGPHRSAFVHVLALDELWAHCVDLPPELGVDDEAVTAMAAAPDGRHLYVADLAARLVTVVDTTRLEAAQAVRVPWPDASAAAPASAAVAADGRLVLAAGGHVQVHAPGAFTPLTSWTVPGQVAGLHLAAGGHEVLAVLSNRAVVRSDAATGARLELLRVPGTGLITSVGAAATRVEPAGDALKCAC